MIGYQGNIYDLPCGDLCESEEEAASCMPQSASTPTFEEVGCFYDDSPRSMTLAVAPACDGTMSTEVRVWMSVVLYITLLLYLVP